jgi:hypothetical protein
VGSDDGKLVGGLLIWENQQSPYQQHEEIHDLRLTGMKKGRN